MPIQQILILGNDESFKNEVQQIINELSGVYDIVSYATLSQLIQKVHTNLPAVVVSNTHLSDGFTGANVASVLSELDVPVIFISENANPDAFEAVLQYRPTAFLAKPIPTHILKYTLALALQKSTNVLPGDTAILETDATQLIDDIIFVRSNNLLSKITIADIMYVSTEGNYSIIHTQDKRYVVKISLINMKELFDSSTFFQVHRSYLVQMVKVDTVNLSTNELSVAGQLIPIGRKYKERLINSLIILK